MIRLLTVVSLAATTASAAVPVGCTGSASLGTFQLLVRPFSQGSPLPLKAVAAIPGGARLIWNPVHLVPQVSSSAEVTAVLVPAAGGDLVTLEPRKAAARTEWQLPERPHVIALIFGPQGLSEGKINSLVTRNRELLRQLADYAEESSEVESLVQQLANAEQAGIGTDAVLKGFSSQYGAGVTRLDPKASSDQQAAMLLKALLPASSTYDPLAARSTQAQQSSGLAASVAGLFFGSPVGLAAGGAALLQNLHAVMFPGTEFRSAFAQAASKDSLALCTKNPAPKSKIRTAYLWAYRVPQLKTPELALDAAPHLPIGSKSTVKLAHPAAADLALARDWHLVPQTGAPIPVEVKPEASAALEIDLTKIKASAGDYRLAATWDWDSLPVAGTLHLHAYSDFAHVALAPVEHDRLVEGSGSVPVKLTGADFEFLENVALESTAKGTRPLEASFTLPAGKRAGPQDSVTVTIDTAKRGAYKLLLAQSDGVAHHVPITVLPPNPKFSVLPVRVNQGEARQKIRLEGAGLDRIQAVSSDAGHMQGAANPHDWSGEISLNPGIPKGLHPLTLKVDGLDQPLTVPDAIEVVGPRPAVQSVQKSLAGATGIAIAGDELPAGTAAGLALRVNHLEESARPRLELGCAAGELRQKLTLSPSEPSSGASLTSAGPGALYLSVDPGAVGYAGCRLTATVITDPEGRSDPFVLGRVIRVPRLEKFTLTSEKVGDSSYAGTLEGRDLDMIEKTGWDPQHGLPVESIPAPIPGDSARQTLRIVLPWPAPQPHAPLYVWLRGETEGRQTAVAY